MPSGARSRKGAASDQAKSKVGGVEAQEWWDGKGREGPVPVPQTETAIKKSHLIQVHL